VDDVSKANHYTSLPGNAAFARANAALKSPQSSSAWRRKAPVLRGRKRQMPDADLLPYTL
jgi:hypothetical protein